MLVTFGIIAVVLYLVSAIQIWRRLNTRRMSGNVGCGRNIALLWVTALIFHGLTLGISIASAKGINLGITQALSVVGWSMAFMVIIAVHSRPVEGLGIITLPFAALTVLGELFFANERIIPPSVGGLLAFHIFISLIATSFFGIAAIEAMVLWYQDYRLKKHRPGGWLRVLPPLQHTESLLFQTIGVGFVLLTIALITGLAFIRDFLTMASPQRTILFVIAWLIFGSLLIARRQFGWRGQVAIRWTLSGFSVLLLAYLTILMYLLFS